LLQRQILSFYFISNSKVTALVQVQLE